MSDSSKPNVLMIVADDQRFDTIAALNNPDIITPNLDRLVRSGTAFTNAYFMGGTMPAVCCPSRGMMLSGRYLYNLKDSGREIPATDVSLPETLTRAGYDTIAVGKQHNGQAFVRRAFHEARHVFNKPWWGYYNHGVHFDMLRDKTCVPPERWYPEYEMKHTDEAYTDAAVSYLCRRDKTKPFFMHLAFVQPHDPIEAPERFRNMYPPTGVDLPPNYLSDPVFNNGSLFVRRMQQSIRGEVLGEGKINVNWRPLVEEEMRNHLATYYAMVTHLDHLVGRVLKKLEHDNELENTIVVFVGDNGIGMGQHGHLHKQTVYDHDVHVPLLFCGPGIPKGEQRDTLCYIGSIYPTLCDLLGVGIPGTVDFQSILPSIQNPAEKALERLYFAHNEVQRAEFDGRYKLIEYNVGADANAAGDYPPPGRKTQLFDHADDRWELHDLSAMPEHGQTIARLRQQMLDDKAHYNDHRPFWDGVEL